MEPYISRHDRLRRLSLWRPPQDLSGRERCGNGVVHRIVEGIRHAFASNCGAIVYEVRLLPSNFFLIKREDVATTDVRAYMPRSLDRRTLRRVCGW